MDTRTTTVVAGVDVGTTCVKAVVLDGAGNIAGRAVVSARAYFEDRAQEALSLAAEDAKCDPSELAAVCATGFGSRCAPFATSRAGELVCLARGAHFHYDEAVTLVDLGGQHPKLLRIDEDGRRIETRRARKCVVGVGAFLCEAARQLDVHPTRLQDLASAGEDPATIGSYCSVFATEQIQEHLREGVPLEAVALGCIQSIADRIVQMGGFEGRVIATGGVAEYFPGILRAIAANTGLPVEAAPSPIVVCAHGAALVARESEAS